MDEFFRRLEGLSPDKQIGVAASDSPAGGAFPMHAHHHGQLIHAISGVMLVRADAGSWVVPTGRAVWVPAGTKHAIQMAGTVEMRTLFVAPEVRPCLPAHCRVIAVSPLLRELIVAACRLPADYEVKSRTGRMLELILDELELAEPLSLHVPMPHHAVLESLCMQVIREPSRPVTLVGWATDASMQERTFARRFKRETGMTPGAWCRQARLLLSLPRLVAGVSILEVALEHGYESPSAFAAAFRRTFGVPPSDYFRR